MYPRQCSAPGSPSASRQTSATASASTSRRLRGVSSESLRPASASDVWPPSDIENDPVDSVRRYLDAVNSHDVRRVLAAMSPGYNSESLLRVGDADRREDVVGTLKSLLAAFPDFHVRLHEIWQVGTETHVSVHLVGTFLKTFDSPTGTALAASGTLLELEHQVFTFRCHGGRVTGMRWPRKDEAWSAIKAMVAGS